MPLQCCGCDWLQQDSEAKDRSHDHRLTGVTIDTQCCITLSNCGHVGNRWPDCLAAVSGIGLLVTSTPPYAKAMPADVVFPYATSRRLISCSITHLGDPVLWVTYDVAFIQDTV